MLQCANMRPSWNCFPTTIRKFYSCHQGCVFIFRRLHNKLSQIWWLITTENYSLTVIEAEKSKSSCQQSHGLSEGSREECFHLPSFWWLPEILGILWLIAALFHLYACLFMAFFSRYLYVSFSLLVRIPVLFRAHSNLVRPHLN